MSNKNLIPFNERTEEEQRKIARQGGIASGVARRKKKTTGELINKMLSSPAQGLNKDLVKKNIENLEDEELTVNALV